MCGETKSSLGIAIPEDDGFGSSRQLCDDTQTLIIEYSVTYVPGILGYWAIIMFYTRSLIFKNSKKKEKISQPSVLLAIRDF